MAEMIWWIMETGISALVITTIVDIIVMGSYRLKIAPPCEVSRYMVRKENRIDIQKGNECAGYATAYLLRHYDIPADGTEIYQKMPFKASDGCVPPKGIRKVLESYGFRARYCAGNLNALKREVCKGAPVIVFIKSRADRKWLHFVPVVGFDEDNLYLADSAAGFANCGERGDEGQDNGHDGGHQAPEGRVHVGEGGLAVRGESYRRQGQAGGSR